MQKRIRRGGLQTRRGFLFELSGGNLALDFANTLDNRPTRQPRELLPTFKELCSWSRQSGILSGRQEHQFVETASHRKMESESARRLAVSIRECLFHVFKHVADGEPIPSELLKEWNRFVHRAMNRHELIWATGGVSWRCAPDVRDFASLLWPVVHSAVQLLIGPNVSRVRRCAARDCDWLFLDTSKRGNRRWCDMTVCGNRAKAQRFYFKKKALTKKAAAPPSGEAE